MGTIASQITSLTVVYSTVYSDVDQRKHQSSASLAFVWGIHREPVNSPHKWPVMRKMFPFDDVIMYWEITTQSIALNVYDALPTRKLILDTRNILPWIHSIKFALRPAGEDLEIIKLFCLTRIKVESYHQPRSHKCTNTYKQHIYIPWNLVDQEHPFSLTNHFVSVTLLGLTSKLCR